MKKLQKLSGRTLVILPYLSVFIFSLYNPSDPDLGWHLKYGEYFWRHGTVLRDNTFSTMMPDYRWINHSWGTDILAYAFFHVGGFFALTIVSAFIITLTFYFAAKAAHLNFWDEAILFPLLLFLLDPINNISFRSQLLSLLFLSLLFYIVSYAQKKNLKLLLLLSPLFMLWANIHGEFIFGLVIFVLWSAIKIGYTLYLNKYRFSKDIIILVRISSITLLLSFFASLINPFGIGVYFEALHHFGNPMEKYIEEWLPLQQFSQPWWNQIIIGILISLGIIFLFFSGKGGDIFPFIGIAVLLFILPFWERRYAWPMYYLILPILRPLSEFFKSNSKNIRNNSAFVILLATFVFALVVKYPISQFYIYSWKDYCKSVNVFCSSDAAEYLLSHHLYEHHKLYTLYGWGGWLIWNYPQIKPTIDGRMSFWVDENGYSGFKEYYWIEQAFNNIDKSKYDVAFMSPGKPVFKRLVALTKEGKWKEVYHDQYAGIFVRND